MMWKLIKCPDGRIVGWEDCLACEGTDNCPLRQIRAATFRDLQARLEETELLKKRLGVREVFHVTELCHLRYAYFNRTTDYIASWDSVLDYEFGKAYHSWIERLFPCVEIPCWVRVNDDFAVVGRADAYDPETRTLWDFKTYANLFYLDEPAADHVFQITAYYTMLRDRFVIDRLGLCYVAKTRGRRGEEVPRIKIFYLEPRENAEFVERAAELFKALRHRKPPSRLTCADWKCRVGCPFVELCFDNVNPSGMPDREIRRLKMRLEGVREG